MKKLILPLTALALTACSVTMTPEMRDVREISSAEGCQFIDVVYAETIPRNVGIYIRKNTVSKGGDSYRLLSTTPISILTHNDSVATTIEVFKCK